MQYAAVNSSLYGMIIDVRTATGSVHLKTGHVFVTANHFQNGQDVLMKGLIAVINCEKIGQVFPAKTMSG